jgi:hypothetical protein
MVIGILGIGSGLGFFIGPQYAGWSAVHGFWHASTIGSWQRPCIELGILGIFCGIAFLIFAREAPGAHGPRTRPHALSWPMRWNVLAIAATLGCRDFAGVASISLTSIYLLRAQGRDAASAGLAVGAMMLIGVVVNPLAVWISPGRKRLPFLALSLVAAGLVVCTVPWFSAKYTMAILCVFQACHLGSYSMSDAAVFERVEPSTRGRVTGLFLNVAGTAASTSPWVMGFWTDHFGDRAAIQRSYYAPFIALGAMMVFASVSVFLISRLGSPRVGEVSAISEIEPAMMEVAM